MLQKEKNYKMYYRSARLQVLTSSVYVEPDLVKSKMCSRSMEAYRVLSRTIGILFLSRLQLKLTLWIVGCSRVQSGAVGYSHRQLDAMGSSQMQPGAVRCSRMQSDAVGCSHRQLDAVGSSRMQS